MAKMENRATVKERVKFVKSLSCLNKVFKPYQGSVLHVFVVEEGSLNVFGLVVLVNGLCL